MGYLILAASVIAAALLLAAALWWFSTRQPYPEADRYAKKYLAPDKLEPEEYSLLTTDGKCEFLLERVAALEERVDSHAESLGALAAVVNQHKSWLEAQPTGSSPTEDSPMQRRRQAWELEQRVTALERWREREFSYPPPTDSSPDTPSPATDANITGDLWDAAEPESIPLESLASSQSGQPIMTDGPAGVGYYSAGQQEPA